MYVTTCECIETRYSADMKLSLCQCMRHFSMLSNVMRKRHTSNFILSEIDTDARSEREEVLNRSDSFPLFFTTLFSVALAKKQNISISVSEIAQQPESEAPAFLLG